MLKSLGGRDIVLLTQKSGMVYALDPERRGKLYGKAEWDAVGRLEELNGVAPPTGDICMSRFPIMTTPTLWRAAACSRSI